MRWSAPGPAVEGVVAGDAGEDVVAALAEEGVGVVGAGEGVVAGVADEGAGEGTLAATVTASLPRPVSIWRPATRRRRGGVDDAVDGDLEAAAAEVGVDDVGVAGGGDLDEAGGLVEGDGSGGGGVRGMRCGGVRASTGLPEGVDWSLQVRPGH